MDWSLDIKGRKLNFVLDMKTQIMLRKSHSPEHGTPSIESGPTEEEMVWRLQENWNGRTLAMADNTFPGCLGWLQEGLRRGVGWMGAKLL